jgi:hypothetical protein
MFVEGSHLMLLDGGLKRRKSGISITFGGMWIGEFEDVLGEAEVRVFGKLRFTHDGGREMRSSRERWEQGRYALVDVELLNVDVLTNARGSLGSNRR